MAAKKKKGRSSSGSDPKSKRIVKGKMKRTMEEYKHHDLESGRSGKKVKSRKQAIAIGLSQARRSGADIPLSPNEGKRAGTKKKAVGKKAVKRSPAKKS